MRYSRVLLLQPKAGDKFGGLRPPVGLGYLSEYLEQLGIETAILDLFHVKNRRDLFSAIRAFQPDLLGCTLYTVRYQDSYELLASLKGEFPDLPLVVGGPHVSTFRSAVLEACPAIDFGVVLEGEHTLHELCTDRPFHTIKGLLHRADGNVIYNGDRAFIKELDEVPFPTYKRLAMENYIPEKFIISSRGCPYKCSFCPVHTAVGRLMRYRSPASILAELRYWYRRGFRQFDFQDDNFTLLNRRVLDLCDLIDSHGLSGLLLRCSNGIRADRVDRNLLERMHEVGFSSIAFGVESANDPVLELMHKSTSVEEMDRAVAAACDIGYDVHLFFLVGMPGESEEDLQRSYDFAKRYPVLRVSFYNVIPYPGTELYSYLEENELFVQESTEYLNSASSYSDQPVFVTPELDLDARVRWLARFRKLEKEIMRRGAEQRMRRWGRPVARIGSYLFATDTVQRLIFENIRVRKLADRLRYAYLSEDLRESVAS